MTKPTKNTKSINYYDTPMQRRQYGDLYADIMSALTKVMETHKDDFIHAEVDISILQPNKNNNKIMTKSKQIKDSLIYLRNDLEANEILGGYMTDIDEAIEYIEELENQIEDLKEQIEELQNQLNNQ